MKLNRKLAILLCVMTQVSFASDLPLDFTKNIQEQILYSETHQSAVWPGFHPGLFPSVMVFVEGDENAKDGYSLSSYALNYEPGILPWEKVDDTNHLYFLADAKQINFDEKAKDGQFTNIDGIMSFLDIEDVMYAKAERNFRNKFMYHYGFNFITKNTNINPENFQFSDIIFDDFLNKYYQKLIFLEESVLNFAQKTSDKNTAEKAYRDAIAIHQYRNLTLSESSRQFVNGLEFVMGIPNFISLATNNYDETNFRKMSQRSGCSPLSVLSGAYALNACASYQFGLYSGAAYGHYLDGKLDGQWKKDSISKFISIPNQAQAYFKLSDKEALQLTERAMQDPNYQFQRISDVVEQVMTPYLKKLNQIKQEWHQNTPISVRFDENLGIIVYIIGFFDAVFADDYTLSFSQILIHDLNYDFNKISNNTFDLIFKHTPVMILNLPSNWINPSSKQRSYTDIYLSNDAIISVDGIRYRARDVIDNHLKLSFYSHWQIDDSYFHYSENGNGKVEISDGAVNVHFDNIEVSESIKAIIRKVKMLHQGQSCYFAKWLPICVDRDNMKKNRLIRKN